MVKYVRIGIATLVIWVVTGVMTWTVYTLPRTPKLVSTAKRSDLISLAPSPDLKSDIDILGSYDLWGFNRTQAQVATASQPTERWVRVAIVSESKDVYLLLQSPSGEVKSYHPGDTLPDGSKLLKVSAAEVITRPVKGKIQTFRLMD